MRPVLQSRDDVALQQFGGASDHHPFVVEQALARMRRGVPLGQQQDVGALFGEHRVGDVVGAQDPQSHPGRLLLEQLRDGPAEGVGHARRHRDGHHAPACFRVETLAAQQAGGAVEQVP